MLYKIYNEFNFNFICHIIDKMDRKSPSQVFKEYQVKLLQILPMDDAVFKSLLIQNNFFYGNRKATLMAQSTRAGKASYFLNSIIEHHIEAYFETLLNVMEAFGDPTTTLAQEIKEKIGLKSCQGTL